jgi:hypothetical protein
LRYATASHLVGNIAAVNDLDPRGSGADIPNRGDSRKLIVWSANNGIDFSKRLGKREERVATLMAEVATAILKDDANGKVQGLTYSNANASVQLLNKIP